ncbi:hypothetical protein GCM10008018_71540 [Paenibacillus marchantiophytorum]|uniref:Uncharacterized protein n=1 Tax=Paenibacillus marchantiophytorum TaxID=1619310 RepID=A0ABQ1FK23_9BACL|nr:hypothetical protein [Paenibacillus marchantiophytorum]GGA16783.1 hypothetical protein GCM10008018_71540 [Paenibacillus marchantiophytorum]
MPTGTLTGRQIMIGNQPYYAEAPTTVDWGTVPEACQESDAGSQ